MYVYSVKILFLRVFFRFSRILANFSDAILFVLPLYVSNSKVYSNFNSTINNKTIELSNKTSQLTNLSRLSVLNCISNHLPKEGMNIKGRPNIYRSKTYFKTKMIIIKLKHNFRTAVTLKQCFTIYNHAKHATIMLFCHDCVQGSLYVTHLLL